MRLDPPATGGTLRFMDPEHLCPDLLGLDYIGPADHLRGRVVRGFFWLMRLWPKPRASSTGSSTSPLSGTNSHSRPDYRTQARRRLARHAQPRIAPRSVPGQAVARQSHGAAGGSSTEGIA